MWMSKLARVLDIFCHLNTIIFAMKRKEVRRYRKQACSLG